MVEVVKKRDLDNTYIIFIKADEGDFVFNYCGNLDLYFSYFGEDYRKKDEHSFIIDKNNYFLYRCFADLYDAVESERPFKGHSDDNTYNYVYEQKYLPFRLLKKDGIKWHSDDGRYEEAAILHIERLDEAYKITIKEGKISDIAARTASVRFRGNGSRYYPYNNTFMDLYNKICNHNFEYEQITLDEYMERVKIRQR